MITVFADKYLFELESFLPGKVDLHFYEPEDGAPGDQANMDALLIRTVTKINEDTWQQVPENLQFIGTGSAGTDHVDLNFLDKHNITFADAAGCNARSVAEYVATALLLWSEDLGYELKNIKAGIIGVGHVGSEVDSILRTLGVSTICYDPPRQEREENFKSADLEEALSADILTFHTPLTRTGKYPTFHWLDESKLAEYRYDLIINTARGGVVDEKALYKAYTARNVQNFVLDVWEGEPVFNDLLATSAYIKTPHIAGYSKQAKLRASKQIAEALCKHFSLKMHTNSVDKISENRSHAEPQNISANLTDVLTSIHPIKEYEKNLTTLIGVSPKEKGKQFNKLRATLPLRNEYRFLTIPQSIYEMHSILKYIGLKRK